MQSCTYKQREVNAGSDFILKEEREKSVKWQLLPKLNNTVIVKTELEKYADDGAAHLKLVADFLKPGEGVWWKEKKDIN